MTKLKKLSAERLAEIDRWATLVAVNNARKRLRLRPILAGELFTLVA